MTQADKKRQIEMKSLRERFLLHEQYFTNETNIYYTPYKGNDQYDASWISNDNKVIAEVKIRLATKRYNSYMIQKDKYEYLMSRANEYDVIYFIYFFEDGILVWNLKELPEPIWREVYGQHDDSDNVSKIKIGSDLFTKDACISIDKKISLSDYFDKAENEWHKRNKK